MSKDEWFRNTKWNKEIEEFFEMKLKRARGSHSKAQYLRIQGSYLLDSNKSDLQEKGIELMKRLLNEYPEETFHTIFATEQLGDYYLRQKNYQNAEQHFRTVANHYYTNTRSGTSGIADIKLSRTILESNQPNKYEEAVNIATEKFDTTEGSLTMNDNKFYYSETLALLFSKMNKIEDAKYYAEQAIEFEINKEPQFSRHKTVGIVNVDKERIEKLKKIINR